MSPTANPVPTYPIVRARRDATNAGGPTASESHIQSPADVYEAYFDVAWRNLRRLGVGPGAIEDAVQDVFLVVHRKWDGFRRESTVRTWVIGICLRVAKDYRRKRLRAEQDQVTDANEVVASDCPQIAVERQEATRLLMTLLETLDDNQRNVLTLVEFEGLTVAEAADAIGIPVSTAYKRLTQAVRSFERAVERQKAKDGWRFGCKR